MSAQPLRWLIQPVIQPPEWFLQEVRKHAPDISGHYAAQLLWQRGIKDCQKLAEFLNPKLVQPASPFEFGQEMHWAVERLQSAFKNKEKVAIWGDFDADGITATAVLWDGLGEFFQQHQQLSYYVPDRLKECHGLNRQGIDFLAKSGVKLIVTCDTGSTNLEEIEYAAELGIDIIVTDHHKLPAQRPQVVAIINPRYLPVAHPLQNLSGVAVAYKLVEALYMTLPDVPRRPVEDLLDLVAIGLIADLVQLSGDCRYLAQLGIARLQKQLEERTRPGVACLLELCKRNGARPTDISFGIGPRINAVSRIYGDATFCVELLTSRDEQYCQELAEKAELANARRQSLQKEVTKQVKAKLEKLDLSTTCVIVLDDPQWHIGVLGLVASQIAEEYGRPTILLSTEQTSNGEPRLARGSARSVSEIDLYQLVKEHAHLLYRFGGHPMAAGLSLPVENITIFAESINRQLRQQLEDMVALKEPSVQADLTVTVAELGKSLFRELKLLEPCGIGNPVPRLLIRNCMFENLQDENIKDVNGKKIEYIKTKFKIKDDSKDAGFSGVWRGHYKYEVPAGRCDALVELDYNMKKKDYEVRLIAVRSTEGVKFKEVIPPDWIVDLRSQEFNGNSESFLFVNECPTSWEELQNLFRLALSRQQKLAIAYSKPEILPPDLIWKRLVGVAKYLNRTQSLVKRSQLCNKVGISARTLLIGLQILSQIGFQVSHFEDNVLLRYSPEFENISPSQKNSAILAFFDAVKEENFRREYFGKVPISTIQSMLLQNI
ncbi:MAG: single-stranded-DNA-specific exonuclease RecJ [Oscillatoriaceae bacterium SKW80]|nr:single-stranded-DNA-specific exonuclease RecJ [Oscillatoriaceae bacterium SKYG93]MCX8120819.1 single-stranded-DNA-specific exonuclease RecJ [Oscillatoriaceae bacterium SKW80]MDW8453695.1 single-stranded-DNA-specific exonuclease RecJ [Oscillatoriaceae cyanobacterium SKYGB_i_bin93]HIK27712.1 single-stranded-DNA-specific exonuclease RecJ [Oscillatoriaceae cyanobacterium M7585_C2015_266]